MIKKLVPAETFILLPEIYKTNFYALRSHIIEMKGRAKISSRRKNLFSPFKVFI